MSTSSSRSRGDEQVVLVAAAPVAVVALSALREPQGRPEQGRGATGSGQAAAQPVRQRLNGLITAFVGSGARTETMSAPTETMRATLAEAKADLAAIEKEIK
jgi:hypothetical protein